MCEEFPSKLTILNITDFKRFKIRPTSKWRKFKNYLQKIETRDKYRYFLTILVHPSLDLKKNDVISILGDHYYVREARENTVKLVGVYSTEDFYTKRLFYERDITYLFSV